MKKYTVYLRPDQIELLKSVKNASALVRLAIDVQAMTELAQAEKTITAYHITQDLEKQIETQQEILAQIKEEHKSIEGKIQRQREMHEIAKQVVQGKFQIVEKSGKFYAMSEPRRSDGKQFFLMKADSEEQLQTEVPKKMKPQIEQKKEEIKNLESEAQTHNTYIKAQKQKLNLLKKILATTRNALRSK